MPSSKVDFAPPPSGSFPMPQGYNSPTFHPPPVDGTLCIPELFEYHAEHSPEHPLFIYADEDSSTTSGDDCGTNTRTIKYPEAWRKIQRAARIVNGHYMRLEDRYARQDRESGIAAMKQKVPPTIGILANADSISFFTTIVAMMRLNLTPFPLSVRNSPVAVAHLIKKAQLLQVFVSPDPAMQRLIAEARDILRENDGIEVEVLEMIRFKDIEDDDEAAAVQNGDASARATRSNEVEEIKFPKVDLDSTAVILHSSGTTSFPKPIYLTHRMFLQWCMVICYGEVDVCGTIVAAHTCPLYHGMGMFIMMWTCIPGMIMAVFKPASPPVISTPEAYLEEIIKTKSEVVFCVPSVIETWSHDLSIFDSMKSVHSITFGGAPMTKSVGDTLTTRGLTLIPFFGLTEVGCLNLSFPSGRPTLDTWEWFEFSPNVEFELLPQDEGADENDIFELCIIDVPHKGIAMANATSKDGRPMYRTSDLIQRHPKYSKKWRVYGRVDDQIMLSTGEKTNPGPLEAILLQDPHVAYAIMFGRGQTQNGILVDPAPEYAFDPEDEEKLVEFRNKIWPTVERMNDFAPAHSRLFKEMIIVSKPEKPFEFNSKGGPRRHGIISKYEPEIQALYAAVQESSQADIAAPGEWTEESVERFVRRVVTKVMDLELEDDMDLFQQGCDSLQATYIRNAIIHALREALSSSGSRLRLPNSFVYNNPTISALASYILSLFSSNEQSAENNRERIAKSMQVMVSKYGCDFPVHNPHGAHEAKTLDEVVLVSGTSGRLGAHLLAQLLVKPSVTRVYALNRPSKQNILERQLKAFENWELDGRLLAGGKVVLLEVDFTKADFGVGETVYNEMRDSVTSIIHNAWRVDFNVALSSFEPLVVGIRNLIGLALSSPHPSPPPILFTSSISTIMASPIAPVPETPVTDPLIAALSGYSQSKWVAETLLLQARKERALCVNVVRVGQLAGDSRVGGWNEKEWLPVLLRGSQVLGAVPERTEEISWIPVDVAASALIDMIGSSEPVMHLVHPYPVSWTVVSSTASTVLGVPIVPYSEWLSRLQHAAQDAEADSQKANPALKLFDFFEKDMGSASELALATDKAVKVSSSLMDAKKLENADVKKWLSYWQKIGFLRG